MSEDLFSTAERAVELGRALGAQGVAARADRSREVELRWRNGKVETVKEATTRSLAVELYVDGRYGTVTTRDLRPEALEAFLRDGIALTRSLAPDPHRALPDPALYAGRASVDLELEDGSYAARTAEKRREVAAAIEAAAREVGGAGRIVSVTSSATDTREESVRVTSNGFRGQYAATRFVAGASVSVADPDGRKPADHSFAVSRQAGSLPDPSAIGREAAERTLARIGSKKLETAVLTMAVENRAAGRLVTQLLAPLTGFALQQKRSFLQDRLGTSVGSRLLQVADDPLIRRGLGSRLYDAEGLAARPLPLFDEGVLRNYFIDTYYGRKLAQAPTTGSMSNLAWRVGDRSRDELLRDMKEGILVTSFLGGNSNSTSGDFSLGVNGHRVREGRLAEPVSELNVADNQAAFWKRLVAVGNDPYPYAASRTPTLVFEAVTFAGV